MVEALLLVIATLHLLALAVLLVLVVHHNQSTTRRWGEIEVRLDRLLDRSLPDQAGDELREVRHALDRGLVSLTQRIDQRTEALRSGKKSVEQRTRRVVAQDVHALLTMHALHTPRSETLRLTSYSADPDTVLHLTTLVSGLPDNALVVELGSGLSTVWMAAAAKRENRGIRVVSFDHDDGWGLETLAALERQGLGECAEVRIAHLARVPERPAESSPWYDVTSMQDLSEIALLVVDGPPASTGENARQPAVPVLATRLASHARIVMDDTDRDEEREIVEGWIRLLEVTHHVVVERQLDRTTILKIEARGDVPTTGETRGHPSTP